MRLVHGSLLALLLATPVTAVAQEIIMPPRPGMAHDAEPEQPGFRRLDISLMGGGFISSDWSDLVLLGSVGSAGLVEQVVVRDLGLKPGTGLDAIVTYWRDRYGFRVHGAYSRSCVGSGTTCPELAAAGTGALNVDTYLYNVGGAIGLRPFDPSHAVRPYVFAGVGGITYDLERPLTPGFLSLVDERTRPLGGPFVIEDDATEFLLAVEELGLETSFAFNFGVGTEFRVPLGRGSGAGLRIEAADYVSPSPIDLRVRTLSNQFFFTGLPETRVEFGPVHHLRLTAGIVLQFGL